MNNSKDCTICVYNGVCEDRIKDETITDCCVPEKPLREKQAIALKLSVEDFIYVTNRYISGIKNKSNYWVNYKY